MALRKQPQTVTIIPGERISAREYAQLPDEPGFRTELHEGVVVRMALIRDLRHEWVASNLHLAVASFVKAHRLGRVSMEQGGYDAKIAGETDDSTYGPDIAFLSNERIPLAMAAIAAGDYAPAPDLIAEVVSKSQTRKEVAERSERWLAAGTRLVWNVWLSNDTVDIWTPDTPMQIIGPGSGVLDGQDVLPGFTLALVDLFA